MQTLRTYRQRKGLSQNALAVSVGVSQAAIQTMETGTICLSPENREKIAHTLDVSPDEIAWGGPDFVLAEVVRLAQSALDADRRGDALAAMRLLTSWLSLTRPDSLELQEQDHET